MTMTASGLLLDGKLVAAPPGLRIVPPASHGGPAWCTLSPGDYRARRTRWVRAIVLHTTKGIERQRVIHGAGPGGADRVVADFWRGDANHSAAHIVVDTDGSIACLGDLVRVEAYHATSANPWSVGIEMYQLSSGGIYEATLDATAALVQALCGLLGIPELMPRGPYRGRPLRRLVSGGADVVGVYGHRDQTDRRGRGDPGDLIWQRLAALGFEGVDYDGGEDLELGKQRQRALLALDARRGVAAPLMTDIDGVCGPASLAAMHRQGFARWRDVA